MAAGKSVRLRCESRGGNPPAKIYWYIDDELLTESSQKNETEVGDDRKWNAISVLRIVFKKVGIYTLKIHFIKQIVRWRLGQKYWRKGENSVSL